jgi:hypothetical protein
MDNKLNQLIEKEKNLLQKELSYLSAKKRRFNRMDEEQQVAGGFAINNLHLELTFPEDNEYEFSRDSYDEFECFFKNNEILDLFYDNKRIVDPITNKPITGVLIRSNFFSEFTVKISSYFNYKKYNEALFCLKISFNIKTYSNIYKHICNLS